MTSVPRDIHVLGIGTARPDHEIVQAESLAIAIERSADGAPRRARILRRLYERTQIRARGVSMTPEGLAAFYPPGMDAAPPSTSVRMQWFESLAPPLAIDAARAALAAAGVDAGEVSHLLVVTCTGFAAPGLEIELIRTLGLPRGVARVQLGFMGCHGALAALRVAAAIATADPAARVLVCAVELCSLHYQYGWHPDSIVSNALFADGASGAVIGAASAPGAPAWRVRGCASHLIDGTATAMGWHIGDHGFVMTLAPDVPQILRGALRPWLDPWLGERGLAASDVRSWAIHAGGPRIVLAVAEALELPPAGLTPSFDVLRNCGNMSSATILFILDRVCGPDAPRPCVALSFGPGLTAEAVLLD